VVRDVRERLERERELERQRERLAALNHLNGVVRDITHAVIEQSTREEIERTVCEALAATESYLFAWIGDVDPKTETVRLRAEAGVEGYLDGLTISVDPDDPRSHGPTGRAIRTREIQVTQDVLRDPDYKQWETHANEYGYRSSAAIPIVHEGTLYGILNVYAGRPDAFADEERSVIGQLGEIVGHAIAALNRKHALMSDHVTEIDFHIPDVFAELGIETAANRPITLDQAVAVGGGDYLVYGTVAEEDRAILDALVDALPHWEAVRVVGEQAERTKFELRLSEPPVLTTVASRGGYVKEARIEGEDYHMTIQLPQSVEVRQIIDTVQEAYPSAKARAQRQVVRTDEGPGRVVSAFEEELTDRQRSVLQSAYYAGYFEWPRNSTAEDVANSLGVSSPTVSQHLRAAEKKIFSALFPDVGAVG
jgi:predicted DNA binding protein